jgi:hypothetical protein
MIAKFTKLFFSIYLLSIALCFAKNQENGDTSIVHKYNTWLKSMQLDKLLKAAEAKVVKSWKSPQDSTRNINTQLTIVLILKTSAEYSDAQDAANYWNYIQTGLQERGCDIYTLLLNKLADYANTSINQVRLEALSLKPDIFSFKIYYTDKLVKETYINLVMGGDMKDDYNFTNALNNTVNGFVQLPGNSINLLPYYNKLTAIFSKYKCEPDSVVRFKEDIVNQSTLRFLVLNLYGQITNRKFHEQVTILVSVSGPVNNQIKIKYELSAYCASGMRVVPKGQNNYLEVAKEYPDELVDFNKSFSKEFKDIFYGKKQEAKH